MLTRNIFLFLLFALISGCFERSAAIRIEDSNKTEVVKDIQEVTPKDIPLVRELVTNEIGMRLKRINPGTFEMGASIDDDFAQENELPRRTIKISKPFYIGTTEVTQNQYQAMRLGNPSKFKGETLPVHGVSWADAISFCELLSNLPTESAAQRKYRLPTEAEWEFVCRSGNSTVFCYGDDPVQLEKFAHHNPLWGGSQPPPWGNDVKRVASLEPNDWGVFDMHGNVLEWCNDYYGLYESGNLVDPQGPTIGKYRVMRGGQATTGAKTCRSSHRAAAKEYDVGVYIGFRVVMEMPD